MKQFIIKTFWFVSGSLIMLLGLFLISNGIVTKKASFKIDDDITNLIIGHSHSECGLNDSLIKRTRNFSKSGESYFYTFLKVRQLVGQNPKIKTVFIELSNNVITDRMLDWIWGDDILNEQLSTYFPFMRRHELAYLFRKNKSGFIQSSSKLFRNNVFKITRSDYDFSNKIGHYFRLEGSDIDSLLQDYQPDVLDVQTINFDNDNIKYLKKTVALLKDNEIDVFFIRSPQHENYLDYNNEDYFIRFKDSVFPKVEFFDFNHFPIKKEEFKDFGHLNYIGANKYSQWFNDLLEDGLLELEDKQAFIKIRMKEISE